MTGHVTMTIKQEPRDPLDLTHFKPTYSDFHRCHKCYYRTKSTISLHRHLKRHHKVCFFDCTKSIPTYKCDTCNFCTHLTQNFARHMCDHTDIVPYEAIQLYCKNCNFFTHSHLILLKHVDSCSEQNFSKRPNVFSSNRGEYFKCYQFLTQIRCLTVEWLKCHQCPYTTRMLGNLRTHWESVHPSNSDVKWFECEPCLYNVEQIFHLRNHVLMEHGQHAPELDIKNV